MKPHVANHALVDAGLALMKSTGRPLTRVDTRSRAMIFRLESGELVRIRTCNDHILVVLADSPKPDAGLNIEGTDHLLIIMPRVPRTEGPIDAYLVPTRIAVEAARRTHSEWLASKPTTHGNNRTWNLWFDDTPKAGGFAKSWSKYRLPGEASTLVGQRDKSPQQGTRTLGEVIAAARHEIASAAGVSIEAVKISVALE
jgi:hypothetical protein